MTHAESLEESLTTTQLTGSTIFAGASFLIFSYFHMGGSGDAEVRASSWEFMAVSLRMFCALQALDIMKNLTKLVFSGLFPSIYEDVLVQGYVFIFTAIVLTAIAQYVSLQSVQFTGSLKGIPKKEIAGLTMNGTGLEVSATAFTFIFMCLAEALEVKLHITWPLIPMLGFAGLFWIGQMAIFKALRDVVVFADGVVDPEEEEWLHVTEEMEIEAGGLFLSLCTVHVMRYYIGGVLPNVEGVEAGDVMHKWSQIVTLIGFGLASAVLGISLCEDHHGEHQGEHELNYSRKIQELMKIATITGAGWSILFTIQWIIQRLMGGGEAGIIIRFGAALLMNATAFGFLLGKFDQYLPENGRESAKVSVITGLALATGFGWERCFEDAWQALGHTLTRLQFDEDGLAACDEMCSHSEKAKTMIVMDTTSFAYVFPALHYQVAPIVLGLKGEGTLLGDRRRSAESSRRLGSASVASETASAAASAASEQLTDAQRAARDAALSTPIVVGN